MEHLIRFVRRNEMGRTSARVNTRLSVIQTRAFGSTNQFVGKKIIDGCVHFEDEVGEEKMGPRVIAREIATTR